MKTPFCVTLAAMALGWVGTLHADEALRKVQQSLRAQGFYYGPVNGTPGDETTQAVRRYQIRNGLSVTGQLDDATRRSIQQTGAAVSGGAGAQGEPSAGNGAGENPRSTARPAAPPANGQPSRRGDAEDEENPAAEPGYQRPTVQPVPGEPNRNAPHDVEDDEAPAPRAPSVVPRPDLRADPGAGSGQPDLRGGPPSPEDRPLPRNAVLPSARLSALFASTPYEFAPPPVQVDVLRQAQRALRREGFYDGAASGVPDNLTADSLANFQGVNRLRKTGRLDVNTLGLLRLLPGRQSVGPRDREGGGPNLIFEGRVVR